MCPYKQRQLCYWQSRRPASKVEAATICPGLSEHESECVHEQEGVLLYQRITKRQMMKQNNSAQSD